MTKHIIAIALAAAFGTAFAQAPATPATPATPASVAAPASKATPATPAVKAETPAAEVKGEAKHVEMKQEHGKRHGA